MKKFLLQFSCIFTLLFSVSASADHIEGYVCEVRVNTSGANNLAWGSSGYLILVLNTKPSCGGTPVRELTSTPIFATKGATECANGTYAMTSLELQGAQAALLEAAKNKSRVWVSMWERCAGSYGVAVK